MRRLLLSLIRGAEMRPRRTVLIGIVCMVLGGASAWTLRPGDAVKDMLPNASPSAEGLGRILSDFQLIDDLVLLVDPSPSDGPGVDPAAEAAALADRMSHRLRGDPHIGRIHAGPRAIDASAAGEDTRRFFETFGPELLDFEERTAFAAALQPDALGSALQRFRRTLDAAGTEAGGPVTVSADDPLGLLPRFLGPPAERTLPREDSVPPGDAASIRIEATRPANDLTYASSLVAAVEDAAEQENTGHLQLTLTGAHAIADFTARSVRRDMIVSLAVTMVSLSVLFLIVYRNGRTLPLLLATVNGGLLVAFGVYALAGGHLSPVTAVCGAVLAGLGVDYGLHLLAARRFSSAAGPPALSGDAASRAAVPATDPYAVTSNLGPTLTAACVTSCIGFGSVAFAGVRALTEFAVLGVLGLIATLAMTVFFLPAALRLAGSASGDRPRLDPGPLLRRILHWPRVPLFTVSIVGGMVAGVLALGGPVRFAADLEGMHARPNPPLKAQERLVGQSGGAGRLLVLVTADPLIEGSLAERTRAAEAALRNLAREGDSPVAGVIGPARFLPVAPGIAAAVELPDAATALARFDRAAADAGFVAGSFDGFRETLRGWLSPGPPPTRADLAQTPADRLLTRIQDGTGSPDAAVVIVRLVRPWELLPNRPETLGRIRASIAPVPGAVVTGLAVVGADMQNRIAEVLPRLLALAGLSVVAWLALIFRNPWDVFLALAPAVAGLAAVLATVVATGTELQAANLIALPLTLGLGVDDGIFLVHLARRVRRASVGPGSGATPETLEAAAAGPVHAVLITSITTIAAFGSLWFTRSPAIASLGVLSAVGVAACLLTSIFGLLPALALQQRKLVERERKRREGAPRS